MRCSLSIAVLAGLVASAPAGAHHSFAMFDRTRIATIAGTLKELQWTNPHVWLEIEVPTGGGPQLWSIEGGPVAQLKQMGLRKDMLHAGEKLIVKARPLLNGHPGGSLISIARPDGSVLFGEKKII